MRAFRGLRGSSARVAVLGLVVLAAAGGGRAAARYYPARVAVYFSPRGGATAAVVEALNGARREVLVQAYSFTSAPIARALVAAHRRRVKVTALLDDSNESDRYSEATFISNAGIETWIDDQHAIAHNKIIVVDGATVITGSANFTKAAEESNAENLLVLRECPEVARAYVANFQAHRAHAHRYR